MSVRTVVANGQDNYASYLSWLGGSPLDTRIATYLGDYDQALSVIVDDQSRLFSIWGGVYPFQATIRLDTRTSPDDVASVAERVRLAVTRATGHIPSAVSVVSAGQPVPAKPEPGVVDETRATVGGLIGALADGLKITTTTATVLLVAIGLGGIALVYFAATNPARAARIARG